MYTRPKLLSSGVQIRCIKSMHLLEPLELAILARAFDLHQPDLHKSMDIFQPLATQARRHQCGSGASASDRAALIRVDAGAEQLQLCSGLSQQ